MLRIPHVRKHTPQSSRQTRRSVHKRVHVFHANVTHTTTIPANQAQCPQTRPRIPRKRNTPQPSRQTKRGVHKRASPCQQRHTSKAPTAPHRHNVQPGTIAAYRHKSIPFRPPQSSTLKKARGVCRGAAALRPLCGFPFFLKKNTVRHSPKKQTPHSI